MSSDERDDNSGCLSLYRLVPRSAGRHYAYLRGDQRTA